MQAELPLVEDIEPVKKAKQLQITIDNWGKTVVG